MYFLGFVLLIGGVLAALWKLGILQNIETTWIVIGVVILAGVGIMVSVANAGTKQNIQIDQERGRHRFLCVKSEVQSNGALADFSSLPVLA